MKNAALLTNKLADKEEKAFVLYQKLSEIHQIRHNTMYIKSQELRTFRCNILDNKEKEITDKLHKLFLECEIIKKELKLLNLEEIECAN